ncbi:MAG: bifunctional riboflavin kinase/FMN adenylyltransferase [Armatimonadetes bacterium]|nr:bifunctional riboflavin kinase/FMN adenylyltransferase [Armatimonadota bacterium]
MRVLAWCDDGSPRPRPRAVAVGAFDGLHLGHRQVLDCLMDEARRLGLPSCLVSFEPTPAQFFASRPPHNLRLTPRAEREELLERLGLDELCVLPFDRTEVRQRTAEQFLREVVVAMLGAKVLVGSTSHSMGSDRRRWANIADLARAEGLQVRQVEPLEVQGESVSSTRVRELIWRGRVEVAVELLGREYTVQGEVETGTGTGHKLGFPTLNVSTPPEKLLPSAGVYAGWARGDVLGDGPVLVPGLGPAWPVAINVGTAPTRQRAMGLPALDRPIVEAHVLDWEGDARGERVTVGFVQRLRGEETFADVEQLRRAIAQDIERTRDLMMPRVSWGRRRP